MTAELKIRKRTLGTFGDLSRRERSGGSLGSGSRCPAFVSVSRRWAEF